MKLGAKVKRRFRARKIGPGTIDVTDLVRAQVKNNRIELAPGTVEHARFWDTLNRLWDAEFGKTSTTRRVP